MLTSLEPGKYVIAVSGGVDSMVLLDMLVKQAKSQKSKAKSLNPEAQSLQLVVGHFDHGVRPDSAVDRKLVQKVAESHGLVFEYAEGMLGAKASEEEARKARYAFLNEVRQKHNAAAIITAHHQDDMIETALINLLRGTGRKGLTSLSSSANILRPLLQHKKSELLDYAKTNKLAWREDSTNEQTDYLRNYLRLTIVPRLSAKERAQLLNTIVNLKVTNQEIDKEIANYLQITDINKKELNKNLLNSLTHQVACEVLAEWLRLNDIREFDRKTIERLVVAAKTKKVGQKVDINKQKYLMIQKTTLEISN